MGKSTLILASFLAATTSIAADWFVAKDGDDANSGATRAEAKATIAAAQACLSAPGDRLVIGDGDWSVSEPIVLTNGWCAIGEHGRGATTLIPSLATNIFVLGSASSSISSLTIDFNNINNYNTIASGLVAINPVGSISDCLVKNYKSTWAGSLIRMNNAASHLMVDRCDFENCYISYWTAVFWLENGTADFSHCTFTNCRGCNNSNQYFNFGMVYITKASTFRNCLFLRCKTAGRNGDSDSNIITVANNANAVIESCSFIDCAVLNASNGGAIGCKTLASGNGGNVYNCLAFGCSNVSGTAGFMSGMTYSHCAGEAELAGDGNVVLSESNFAFQCPGDDRYVVISGPSVNQGLQREWMASSVDILGRPRIADGAPDIGCYEYPGHAPATYYVAKDGDDANSGLSRAEAKATIAAGCALLSDYGERLVIGDGDWFISEPIVLTNGWSVSGEHGRGATTLIPSLATNIFVLGAAGSSISGLTIDFNNIGGYNAIASALVAINPVGAISDCLVKNYKSTWERSLIRMNNAASHLVVDRCDFENCYITYWTAVFWLENGTADFSRCTFTNCRGCNDSNEYYNFGMVYATKASTFRNCLFLRCKAARRSGTSDSNIITVANNANAVIENCSFIDCAVLGGSNGGAVGCQTLSNGNGGSAYNCLAYKCVNDFGPAGLMGGVTYSHCAQDTALAGEGNVVVNDDNSTFSNIREGRSIPLTGPALDGGTRLDWMTGATDIAGTDRVVGDAPDIGCYEYSGHAPATYYVAKDGDDANSGLSRAEAKATIAAGYALLSGFDEKLVICDGEWEFGLDPTFVVSNGWTITSENGAGSTTLKLSKSLRSVQNSTDLDVVHPLFSLESAGATLSDLTIDFNDVNCCYVASTSALVRKNPTGLIRDCRILNYYTSWGGYIVQIDKAPAHLDIERCTFDTANHTYFGAFISASGGTVSIDGCQFVNCSAQAKSGTKYYCYGVIHLGGKSVVRNCLFLRCRAYGSYQSSWMSGIVVVGTGTVVENCSFVDCAVTSSQGGVVNPQVLSYTVGSAVNCLAYGNSNGENPVSFEGGASFKYCASENPPSGTGNITLTDSNFRFVNASNGDYRVKRGPSINAGLNLAWMADATDLSGNPRIIDNVVDIGCYERDRPKPTQIFVR